MKKEKGDDDGDRVETYILGEQRVLKYIEDYDYLRVKLGDLGIFDVEAYKKKKKEERLKREQAYQAEKDKKERELYEELKAKYENIE